jgi:mono/diheme cytochrome c family protein
LKKHSLFFGLLLAGISVLITFFSFRVPLQGKDFTATMARGKKVYDQICVACHGVDGGGMPRMNPPLWKTSYVLGDKKALAKIILKGLKGGEVEIEGDRFENAMPAQESMLSDQQIADVLTYVRNSFGNKASSVTITEVRNVRNQLAGKK